MRRPPRRLARLVLGGATAALLSAAAAAAPAQGDPAPRAVLVLFSLEPAAPASSAVMTGLRSALADVPGGVRFYAEYLERGRFPAPDYPEQLRGWLQQKYATVKLDAIVADGVEAVQFLAASRALLWPDVPIVYGNVDERVRMPALPRATGLVLRHELRSTVELAAKLLPDLRRMAVVLGASPLEQRAKGVVLGEVRAAGLEPVDLGGLAWEDLLARVERLPDDAAVLFATLLVDGKGQAFIPRDAGAVVAARANRPVFGLNTLLSGRGIVGGWLVDYGQIGRDVGDVVVRVLDGEDAAGIAVQRISPSRAEVDARQLARWEIPVARVPPGVAVRFADPTPWERYRWQIVATAAIVVAQLLLIALLLVQRARRRAQRASAQQARALQAQLAHLNRVASLGELSSSLAHELGQPLTAILSNARAASSFLTRDPPELGEVKDSLEAIVADDRRASEVIQRLRALSRKEGVRSERVDLNAVARDAVALVHEDAALRGIRVELALADPPPLVEGDPVQLLQVGLNLCSNAIDAAAHVGGSARIVAVRTSLEGGEGELTVEDTGPGIPPENLPQVFEPFFTTKPTGLGMGLSICRTIVEAHHGRLVAESDGRGARLRCILPAAATAAAEPGAARRSA